MLGHHRSDGSKLVREFKYKAWNSKFYDKNAIVKGYFFSNMIASAPKIPISITNCKK